MTHWSQALMACRCGHAAHPGKRCQPAPFGCPCDTHEAAEPKTMNESERRLYYGIAT